MGSWFLTTYFFKKSFGFSIPEWNLFGATFAQYYLFVTQTY